ncbi:MAG: Glycerol-3-phosphate acyltransferase [Syntrophorhabdus sp. PtaU1.Bin153]|nr:MAG: Glycerol-3-phosphate acyltransferase [Syntrophorhabdus sp. PtaU1.Bin153]
MNPYLLVILAYLIGSVPVGIILSRVKGADPRNVGSGNIGATNVMRAAGKVTGILTLAGDVLKGLIPVVVCVRTGQPVMIVAAAGLATFIGHLFPVFLKFRGGKGVATALGVCLGLAPYAVAIDIVVFIAVVLKWPYVSLGSLAAAAAMPLLFYILHAGDLYIYLVVIMAILIFVRHKENIRRLFVGTESTVRGPRKS